MDSRPRLLLIGSDASQLNGAVSAADVDSVSVDAAEVARCLHEGAYSAVLASPAVVTGMLDRFRRDELIIGHIDKGLAILDPAGVITWTNPVFAESCGGEPVGKPLLEALGGFPLFSIEKVEAEHATDPGARLDRRILGTARPVTSDPLAAAREGRAISIRIHRPDSIEQQFQEVDIRPVTGTDGTVSRLIALVRNVTSEVTQQQKLNALHAAGRELAGLDPEQLSEMNTACRVELLKLNLRKFIRDLLHYDTIEVRVLDRRTGLLKPLLEDGMTAEAAGRVLYARPTGNGVTGYVAYTGSSYLCSDTTGDPHYIRGAEDARSSMTVALKVYEEVIGTLNVESPRPNGFGPDDLQFTELFSREIASALNTLELLSAQEECTVSQSIEAVNKEIALPIDEVLAGASVLLERAPVDSEASARLRRILDSARRVKESVSKVGRDSMPSLLPQPNATTPTGPTFIPDDPTPLVGKMVLVVDTDERMRRQAHLLISRLGAKVETAGTALDGLAMAADTPYHTILMDVKPPDLGGYETYRRFRKARPESVVAMTTGFGYDVSHAIVKARQDGMKHVLFKPFRQDQVINAVLEPSSSETPHAPKLHNAEFPVTLGTPRKHDHVS